MDITADTPVDYDAMIAELRQRDLDHMIACAGDTESVRKAHAQKWDTNPACPDCGSMAHFECQ